MCEGLPLGSLCGFSGWGLLDHLLQMMPLPVSMSIKALEPMSGAWSARQEGGGPSPHNELIVCKEVIKKL